MTNNNRSRGNKWELVCIQDLKPIYPQAVSSRAESRNRDAQKVDICYTEPFNFQCKTTKGKINYDEIIKSMPDDGINIILHKQTEKKGKRFYEVGRYAILPMEELMMLIDVYKQSKT